MKKITKWLFLPLLAMFFNAQAQDYQITFAILGSSEKPSTVKIENTTQKTEKTLSGSDILHLVNQKTSTNHVGIGQNKPLHVYPNPISDYASIAFCNPSAGNATIQVVNSVGATVTSLSSDLPQGEVNFTLSGLSKGSYIVNVQANNYHSSCVIISQIEIGGPPTITLNGADVVQTVPQKVLKSRTLKSTDETVQMQYNEGDVLIFTATLGTKDAAIDEYTATDDDVITFSFIYTVSFNDWNGTELTTFEGEYGADVIYPTHPDSRIGYTPNGWDSQNATVPASDDLVITAQYEVEIYNITYHNLGSKSAASNPDTYTINTEDIILTSPSNRTGCTFDGWYTDEALENAVGTPAIETGSTGNKDFYAKWTVNDGYIMDSRDSEVYATVQIGDQLWMAENLRYLPSVDNNNSFKGKTTPGYGVYGYNGSNVEDAKDQEIFLTGLFEKVNVYETFGVLYNGYAVMQIEDEAICPSGWHVPTDEEWNTMESYLNDNAHNYDGSTTSDRKLLIKALALSEEWWDNGIPFRGEVLQSDKPFNSSSFNAIPAGRRSDYNGNAFDAGKATTWWTSTTISEMIVIRQISSNFNYLTYNKGNLINISTGNSVRCIKDK